MTEKTSASEGRPEPTREERLALRLRENLRRRKAQARAMATPDEAGPDDACRAEPSAPSTGQP